MSPSPTPNFKIAPPIKAIEEVTKRIIRRSEPTRKNYLNFIETQIQNHTARTSLTDGNLAHASAACPIHDKQAMLGGKWPNIAIVTAYNDMLSAHQPYETYPGIIRNAARKYGATAQVAGGVPAMCDGVTQGQDGMELSLFSRDIIAMSTGIALSHATFDAALYLGICDKIVPGLLIGAMRFGHLPTAFVPAGPMPSGLPNPEKQKIRQQYAAGEVGRDELLRAESESYHAAGTCTFYGTANTNQMLMEMIGLHVPGSAFIPPGTDLRQALTEHAVERIIALNAITGTTQPLAHTVDEKSIVNAIVGLMATGGSTNLALHIPAIANAAGIQVNWTDFEDIAQATPLLCRIYPNGPADVNMFHAAGGMAFLIRELLSAGLLHNDVKTIAGDGGLEPYATEPTLSHGKIEWRAAPDTSGDENVLRPHTDPIAPDGGLKLIDCALGRGIIKVSAVKPENRIVEAPVQVFNDQSEVRTAFEAGDLNRDVIIAVRYQGPKANGMPELHGLSPILGHLQDAGHKVALLTDGRMSGASGKFPAVIHLGPEALDDGPLAYLQTGDMVSLDANTGELCVKPDDFLSRKINTHPNTHVVGTGRELFAHMRTAVSTSETGGSTFNGLNT